MIDANIPTRTHLIYALVSATCPFMAFGAITVYQGYAYPEYTVAHDSPLADMFQAIFWVGVGSFVGLVFAGLSLGQRPRWIGFGTVALILNAVLLIFAIYAFF